MSNENQNNPNCYSLHVLPDESIKKSWSRLKSTSRMQLNVAKASKQYIYDESNNEYLDCLNGAAHVGHCHPQVVTAGQNQMTKVTAAQGFISDVLSKYVKRLVETLPEHLSVCYLCNSGSEANDLALRLAHAYTGNDDIIVTEEAYHGNLGGLTEISPKMFNPNHRKKDWVHIAPIPDSKNGIYHKEIDEKIRAKKYADDVENIIVKEIEGRGRKLSAFMCEPFFVIPGVHQPDPSYFHRVYNSVHKRGGVVIADEVQTGLGRTGQHYWGFDHYGVLPDIITCGRPLGNGHPMGAVICTRKISDKLGGYYSTFGGNPVSCAIGLAVLDVISNESLVSSAKNVGIVLEKGLKEAQASFPAIIEDVRGQGLIWGIQITNQDLASKVMYGLKNKQILIGITGSNKNILYFSPPMCFTVENSRRFTSCLMETLEQVSLKMNPTSLKRAFDQAMSSKADHEIEEERHKKVIREMEKCIYEEMD